MMDLKSILCAVIMITSNGNKDRREMTTYYLSVSVNAPLFSDLHPALCLTWNYRNRFCRYLMPRIRVRQGDDDRVKLGNNKEDEEESELLLCLALIEMGCPER